LAKGPRKRDYYEVLGVERDADAADLKHAYRELARKYHPDINPGVAQAEDKFKEINEAYAVISDDKARARYDRYGFAGVGAGDGGGSGLGSVVDAFDEIIGDLLKRRRRRKAGRDLRYTLEVTFEEAAQGCTKTIKIPDPGAPEGSASSPRREKEFAVKLPPGTPEGAVKMLKGEGEVGKGGGPTGDLHVIVRIKEHPVFRREGNDVWCDVPISFPQAALGAVVDVPTLDGKVSMRIPAGTQSGRVFRIRSRGVPRTSSLGGVRGDQMVRVTVETPSGLTERQRRLLEEFASASGESIAHPQRRGFLDKVRALF